MDEILVNQVFEESIEFFKCFNDVPNNLEITIIDYDPDVFRDEYVSAVTDPIEHRIRFNRLWIQRGENDAKNEIRFFTFHELRHLVQWNKIKQYEQGESVPESAELLMRWKQEFLGYTFNNGDETSRNKNLLQNIELDANGYAFALLRMYHFGEKSWFPQTIVPKLRLLDEVYDRAVAVSDQYLSKPEIKRYGDKRYREMTGRRACENTRSEGTDMKTFIKEVALPLGLAFCLVAFLKSIYMADGVCDYFLMWLCIGLPFDRKRS